LDSHPYHPTKETIMTDTKAPDQGLLADDGRMHTTECVTMGWWLLDWDADCLQVGVPAGGPESAQRERALFASVILGGA
jgi:hypothetical protein